MTRDELTMSELECAICGREVSLTADHVEVKANETAVGKDDQMARYFFHAECWESVADGWNLSGD
jgi:hypothetical protein